MNPCNLEYERAMLQNILTRPEVIGQIDIKPSWFTRDAHATLFRIVKERFLAGEPAGYEHVLAWALEHGIADDIGGYSYVTEIARNGNMMRDPASVAKVLHRLSEKRRALDTMRRVALSMKDPNQDYQEAVGDLITNLSTVMTGGSSSDIRTLAGLVYETEMDRERSGNRARLYTGIYEVDDLFDGLSQRGMTMFVGASGMGKTAVVNRISLGLSEQGYRVVLHGTETTERERTEDLIFCAGRIDPTEWYRLCHAERTSVEDRRYRQLSERLLKASDYVSELPIHISSKEGGTVEAACARARAHYHAGNCDVLIADYLQDFVWSKAIRTSDTPGQVAHTSTTLKELSASLGIPVICMAQRSDEKKGVTPTTARPQMWDVQWASKAHQDSEEVFGLYRHDYYAETIENWAGLGQPGTIEWIRRKVRRGQRGKATMDWDGPTRWVGSELAQFPRL